MQQAVQAVQAVLAVLAVALLGAPPCRASPAASAVTAQLRAEPQDTYVTAYINVTYRDGRTGEVRSERSETAKFGDGRIGAARGLLVNAVSLTAPGGCATPLVRQGAHRSANNTGLPAEPWVALVPRGHCTFDMKVFAASFSGASAVIIFDDKEADTLDMMDISPEHNITAVLTYHWKGTALAKLADSNHNVYVEITVANRCTRSLNSINRTSVLFVSVSFIVLMIISLAWLVFYYVQRFRYIHAKDRLSRRLCSAAKRALSKIPTRRLKIDDPELVGDGDCCAICIERYRVADVVRALPCRHEFHKSCIDPWLLDHRTCPMCKMDILKHYGFVFTGSQESILHLDIEEVAAFGLVDSPHPPRGRVQQQQQQQQQQPGPAHQQPHQQSAPLEDGRTATCRQPHCSQRCDEDSGSSGSAGKDGTRGGSGSRDQGGRHEGAASAAAVHSSGRRPARPASPGGLSSASVASCGSGASCGSCGSGASVTDSILPQQTKRPQIVVAGGGGPPTTATFTDLSPPQQQQPPQ